MNRRTFLSLVLLGGAIGAAILGRESFHPADAHPQGDPDDVERRVYFVCCDQHGLYSSGVYMRVGGRRAAFDTIREAAPFLRAGDPASAAAGLCGFLFKRFGYNRDTEGTLTIEPPPQPGPDGAIDWKEYGADGDVILINVDEGSAKCCFGSMVGHEVHDLALGGRMIERP